METLRESICFGYHIGQSGLLLQTFEKSGQGWIERKQSQLKVGYEGQPSAEFGLSSKLSFEFIQISRYRFM